MFARTSTWTGTPEALDKWDAGVDTVRPFVAGLDGNAGAYFFIDRASGRALTLTLWKTEEAAIASDAFADQSRARTIAATGVDLLERGQYEVVDRDGDRLSAHTGSTMTGDPMRRDAAQSIIELCLAGLDPETLRERLLPRLRRAVPSDGLWWATVDPATLLFTSTYQEQIPERTKPFFIENEFIADDVNKWVDVARHPVGVRTLHNVTDGVMSESARFTEIFQPLGFGDELRAAFRVHGASWGFLCLHRERGRVFSLEDRSFIAMIAPHVALGLRAGLVAGVLDSAPAAGSPGLMLFDQDLTMTGWTPAAERWLEAFGYSGGRDSLLPTEFLAVAARARNGATPDLVLPRLRVRTKAGHWAVLHASRLPAAGGEAIAVIIDNASAAEVAPIIMLAYGLSEQERTVTGLVCQGMSTTEIAAHARISANTVQDHLKSVFDKVGVRSRRELVVKILRDHYAPNMQARRLPGPSGYFS